MKKTKKYNVAWVVKNGLCLSCGVCAGSCGHNAISFEYGCERNIPRVDESKCINCGLCYDVCPGKGIRLNAISDQLFGNETNIRKNFCSGYYLDSYVGHSEDYNIRYHSATGGMVSQFLMYLLKKKIIDGAVVVRYKRDSPFEPEPFIATTEEDIWESRSSKYVVVSYDKVANEIIKSDVTKRLAVVGLPCHIHGWRLLAMKNKKIRLSIVGYFAIYCSINKTKLSLEYYPWRYGIDRNSVGYFTFRDDGCMGYMKFQDMSGNDITKIPYLDFWYGTHSFFANPRCSLCVDQLGELADISFGDIHIEPWLHDTIGTNSIIVRSEFWNRILKDCAREGFVWLDSIPMDTLVESQGYTKFFKKGEGVKTNFILRYLVGKRNPVYDVPMDAGGVKVSTFLIEIGKIIMRRIGKHRKLWFVVRFFDGKRRIHK